MLRSRVMTVFTPADLLCDVSLLDAAVTNEGLLCTRAGAHAVPAVKTRLSSIRRGAFSFFRSIRKTEDRLSRSHPVSLKQLWHRYEGPTWLVALAVYGGWLALLLTHGSLAWWVIVPAGAWLIAWHGSLQHETIDALTHVPRWLRTLIAYPPLGVFFPFGTYEREHRMHHLAGPHVAETAWDPETFYLDSERWERYPRAVRAIYRANQRFSAG